MLRGANEMFIGNNFMVSARFYKGLPHQEYFIDEKSARDYVNRLYTQENTKEIELLGRNKYGYVKIKRIVRHHEGAQHWLTK